MKHTFAIGREFELDGKEIRLLSGTMHYFRTVPAYWEDRLKKIKLFGCDAVETYIPWNAHEPEEGVFDFSGILDVAEFIRTAERAGLYVILRPAPYICAEWEFGGLPWWLLNKEGIRFRVDNEVYLSAVEKYYEKLFPIIAPFQVTRGGPVIMMQVENEYGSYGDDKAYLAKLRDLMKKYGCEVPLVTSDGQDNDMFACGGIGGVHQTVNFGSDGRGQFALAKKALGDRPVMCMEFWVGWFDAWGCGEHRTGDIKKHAEDLADMMREGSVNFYMFHGGTNFGFMNGANYYDCLTPDVTSYDYDALLTEDGRITDKYLALRETAGNFRELPALTDQDLAPTAERKAFGSFPVTETADLFDNLDRLGETVHSVCPVNMEALGQGYGYILYSSPLTYEKEIGRLRLTGANDRAEVFVDGKHVVTLYDRELSDWAELETPAAGERIDILVENLGRVNYGPLLPYQKKGIGGDVWLNSHLHTGWDMTPLPMKDLSGLDFSRPAREGRPGFYKAEVPIDEPADTFLELPGFGKGFVTVNGFNLGRYWEIGPQKRLYVPAPLLKKGKNTFLVFESEGRAGETLELHGEPALG